MYCSRQTFFFSSFANLPRTTSPMPRHLLSTTTAKPCRELKKAWALLEEKMSDDVFIEKLILQLPSMQEKYVKEAWSQLNYYHSSFSTRNVSKRTLKTEIYAPFFTLMMATAGEPGKNSDCYVSEKEIASSVVALRRSNEPQKRPEKHLAIMKPDAAVTLSPGCDPFTMLLIHIVYPYHEETYLDDKDDPYFIHGVKSPGMTLTTADFFRALIEPDQYGEVALPFLVVTGKLCSLYVTTLDHNGHSRIQWVGYPDHAGNGSNNDFLCPVVRKGRDFSLSLQFFSTSSGPFLNLTVGQNMRTYFRFGRSSYIIVQHYSCQRRLVKRTMNWMGLWKRLPRKLQHVMGCTRTSSIPLNATISSQTMVPDVKSSLRRRTTLLVHQRQQPLVCRTRFFSRFGIVKIKVFMM